MTWPPWRVPLKYKVLALAVGPLLLAMSITLSRIAHHSAELTEAQSRMLEEQLLVAKQLELRSYVGLALSALAPVYAEEDGEAARSRAKAILSATRYGEDGYFFAYDQRGVCLVHPTMPELVGRDVREVVDSRGRHVVPDLIELAKEGGGFQRYSWPKPSRREPVEKLSYVTVLPRWGWVVGTGVYMDDVERAGRALRERATSSVERTLRSVGLVAAFSVALVFIAGVILNTSQQRLADEKLKAMAQRIVLLQEEERAYVSRHLHDGVSQVLVAAKLQLESAARALAASPVGSPRQLALGLEQLSEAIVAVRDVSHELRPLELDRLGLSGALRQLADEFAARSGLSVSFEDDSDGASLGEEASVALFRIVQEALANVTRHARASRVEVRLSARAKELCLRLADDGCGFDVARAAQSPRGGIGLRNVRERVEHLGGHFNVRSRPGHTELEVRLPTSPRQA